MKPFISNYNNSKPKLYALYGANPISSGYNTTHICTIASKINVTPKCLCLPISKLHPILAVVNLLAHNNINKLLWASKFTTAKIECSFRNVQVNTFWVPFILLLMVPSVRQHTIY